MEAPLRVLLVEDDPDDAETIERELRQSELNFIARRVETKSAFERELSEFGAEIILCDFNLVDFTALEALGIAKKFKAEIPFILVTGMRTEEVAMECIREGADDYLLKSSLTRLPAAMRQALYRKQAEADRADAVAALRENERLYRLITEYSHDLIALCDLDGRFRYANPAFEKLLGYRPEELIGSNAFDFVHPDERIAMRQGYLGAMTDRRWQQVTFRFQHAGGEWRWFEVVGNWVLTPEGKPEYAVIIARDITERKQIETRLMRNQRLENVGALAGGIAHDLNNVLSPIFLAVDMLKSEVQSGEGHKLLETIGSSTQRGANLVRQILSFARGVTSGSRETVHLCHLVDEVVALIRNTVPPAVEIYTSCPQRLPSVNGDTTQFHQVLINLCVNARDAMPNGGRLMISAEETVAVHPVHPEAGATTFVVLTVADTGNGIPPEVQDRIFEPFFTTKEPGQGTGLGLSTVKEIVVAHGGFIDLSSEPKQGTVVRIYLPPCGVSDQAPAPAQDSYIEVPEGCGEHVLLVDDEVAILEITRETLESFHYTVSTAKNGEEGLAVYRACAREISVVVTDMMMPVMDGYRMIREIYAVNPRVRIICTSGLGKLNDLGPAEQAQICEVLPKPFSTGKLLRIIRKVIDEDPAEILLPEDAGVGGSLQEKRNGH